MKNILKKIFRKTAPIGEIKKTPSTPLVQTAPLSDDQLKTVSYEVVQMNPPQFLIGCGQSAGIQRDHNEDTLFYLSSILADGVSDIPFGLCVVADGMGGHKNGEIASAVAARTSARTLITKVFAHLLEINPDPMEESLQETIEKTVNDVQKTVIRYAPGGGTTLTLALLMGEQVTIAHVGDSRAYFIYPDGRIQRLTKDHSLVQRMIDLEEITEAEAQDHPQRNVLLKAIGQTDLVRPDLTTHQIPRSGHLMLCSDGLWGVVSETEIYRIVSSEQDPAIACKNMIEIANKYGGPDNISIVLVNSWVKRKLMFEDYYELLSVKQDASLEDIKRAYHEKARKYHPDVNPTDAARELFLAVQNAFEILRDEDKRAAYNRKLENEDYGVPLLRYKITSSRQVLPRLKEDQLVYALMEIECLKQIEEIGEPQAQICLVVDQSTSMKGSRNEMVKANISRLLKNLNGRDMISIVVFSDDAEVILPPTPVANTNLIESKISLITPSGGTEIKKGLQAGMDLLWQGKEKNSASYLVLLTDGQTYGDEEDCYKLAKKAAKRGIIISALGIGHEWNDQFLEKLTSITGGTSSLVNNKEDLVNYLARIFESLDIVYARNLTLFLDADPRFELKSMFQLEPGIIEFSNLDAQIVIGDVLYKKKSVFLLEFLIHPLIIKDKNVELLHGSIKMELPAEEGKKARLFPEFTLPIVDQTEKEKPPREILSALSRLNFYIMQERTRADVKVGNFVNATRRLNYLATRLISAGELQLANRVISESESIQRDHHFTLTGEKDLKYGTKRLLGMSNS